jgi:hypothetical protein
MIQVTSNSHSKRFIRSIPQVEIQTEALGLTPEEVETRYQYGK